MSTTPETDQHAPVLVETIVPHRRRPIFRLGRVLLITIIAVALVLGALWAAAAVYYTDLKPGAAPRTIPSLVFVGLVAASVVLVRRWRLSAVVVAALVACVIAWFFSRSPGRDKQWLADVARAPTGTIDGDRLTIHNVRNFSYGATDLDFTPRWETRTYDLSRLRRVDYILSYWAGESIAHAMVSFGFDDGQQLAVSIETRKEVGEEYSAVQGFFRQYELVYVFADERDVIGVRTNRRGERVYIHRLRSHPERAREVLIDYVTATNELAERPEFYNALTSNCATGVIRHFSTNKWKPSPWTLSLLLPGYSGRWIYDLGATDTSLPYEVFRQRCNVVDEAQAAGIDNPDFSRLIRVGLPDPNSPG